MSRSRRSCPVIAAWLSFGLAVVGCGAVVPAKAHVDATAGVTLRATATPVPSSVPANGTPGPRERSTADDEDGDAVDGAAMMPATTAPAASPGATARPGPAGTNAAAGATVALAADASADPGPEVVARVQRLLLARGIDVGEVDGQLGERTGAGVAGFQQEAGLAANGNPDGRTVARLEAASAAFVAAMPASVVVDLSDQQATVANAAGAVIAVWPVSTGAAGSETPTGSFAVQTRVRTGEAKDAPTVHMDWFTVFDGDVGFHGIPWVGDRDNPLWTPLGQAAVSHGCVRMDDANAKLLYTFLPEGAPVVVQA